MNLKILQWNVWREEKVENIAKEVLRINPDILCAQEFIQNTNDGTDTAKKLADLINYHRFYRESETWNNRPFMTSQGNAIFSKFPIVRTWHAFIKNPNHNPADASAEGRIYLEIDIEANGKVITIGTTHISFIPPIQTEESRMDEINHLVDIIKTKKENYVFTGDLNSPPEKHAVTEISKYLKNAGPDLNEKTWTTKIHDKKGFYENKLNWRIDYIFATPDIKVKSAEIIKTEYSDHLPILAVIEV